MKNGDMSVKKKAKRPVLQVEKLEQLTSEKTWQVGKKQEQQKKEDTHREDTNRENANRSRSEMNQADYRTEACLESFVCAHCGKEIHPEGAGSNHRNHCPYCLYSLHVDETAGDRKAACHGKMEPIAVVSREDGDWSILHQCKLCGKLNLNRALADDNPILLTSLAVKPLASPPFPLGYLEQYLKE